MRKKLLWVILTRTKRGNGNASKCSAGVICVRGFKSDTRVAPNAILSCLQIQDGDRTPITRLTRMSSIPISLTLAFQILWLTLYWEDKGRSETLAMIICIWKKCPDTILIWKPPKAMIYILKDTNERPKSFKTMKYTHHWMNPGNFDYIVFQVFPFFIWKNKVV